MKKVRLDQLMLSKGLAPSREKAKAFIMSGIVTVGGERAEKAGDMVKEDSDIKVKGGLKYVSRGGLKLEKAVEGLDIDFSDFICLDIGASTGGFTDCMLQNGASKVYAVDVGYGQLAWKLRTDDRVKNLERVNARYLTKDQIPDEIDFASVDVSFISLTLILPVVYSLLKSGGMAVVLVKPQFEAGKDQVGKKGVVKDPLVHESVLKKIYKGAREIGFNIIRMDYSPIKGPEGNIEYLFTMKKEQGESCDEELIKKLVEDSHSDLKK